MAREQQQENVKKKNTTHDLDNVSANRAAGFLTNPMDGTSRPHKTAQKCKGHSASDFCAKKKKTLSS